MNWLSSIVIALLTGALGLVCAAIVASAGARWYHVSTFEGAAGYFVAAIALLGGVAGLILGTAAARIVAAGAAPAFLKGLGLSCGLTLAIAGLAAAVAWRLADIAPRLDGQLLDLEVELRLPAGETRSPAAMVGNAHLSLGSVVHHTARKTETGELRVAEARLEAGRWIVPGTVFLFTMRGARSIDVDLGGESVGAFLVPLPARPGGAYERWSDWLPRPRHGAAPWPDSKSSYRFRVVRQIPPPPPPDPAVVEAARFAALMPDAPLPDWLTFLTAEAPAERVIAVMRIVEQRPTDLANAIRSPDPRLRELALTAVTHLTNVAPPVSDAVLADGRDIAEGIRRFNTMPSDAPDFYTVQVELRSRFADWHHAWWAVHQRTGADGAPPVQAILDLASVRAGETSMDEIVINARAHLDGLPAGNRTP